MKRILYKPTPCAICALFFLLCSGQLFAQSDVYLRAETKGFERLPLLIRPTASRNALEATYLRDFAGIVKTDLYYSNVIEPISDNLLLSGNLPFGNGETAGAALPKYALETFLDKQGDQFEADYRVVEMATGHTVATQRFQGCQDKFRLLAHFLADDIVQALTGEGGIAKTRIVFVTAVFDNKELSIVDYDGHNPGFVTKNRSLNLTPAWTKDGQRVIFTLYQNQNPDLFEINVDNGRMFSLAASPGLETSPAVSPDGGQIAFVSTKDGNAEIYVMDRWGGTPKRLTRHPAIDTAPDWSPDGRQLVFASDRTGNPQLYLMQADGSNVRRLPIDLAYCDSPVWSPRGDKIAFVARASGGFDIYTYDLPSGEVLQLTAGAGSNEDPSWSPDGFQLAFSSTRENGKRDIYTMLWDGSQVLRLTFSGECSSPSWSPNIRNKEELTCR